MSRHHEIPSKIDIGGNHIERTIIVPYGRSIDASAGICTGEHQLRLPVKAIADLLPMNEVLTVKQRHTGKELKTAVNQIVIISAAANTRIRMETRYHRI